VKACAEDRCLNGAEYGENFCVMHRRETAKPPPPNKPQIRLSAEGVAIDFPIGDGTATVNLNEAGAKELMTKLGQFSRNPETRKRFVLGVLDLFLKASADDKPE
jgi:hypothetical protein